MICNTIQTIFHNGIYIFRNRTFCGVVVFDQIKDRAQYDIKHITDEKLSTPYGKQCMEILNMPFHCTAQEYSDAFDYFMQYKDKY